MKQALGLSMYATNSVLTLSSTANSQNPSQRFELHSAEEASSSSFFFHSALTSKKLYCDDLLFCQTGHGCPREFLLHYETSVGEQRKSFQAVDQSLQACRLSSGLTSLQETVVSNQSEKEKGTEHDMRCRIRQKQKKEPLWVFLFLVCVFDLCIIGTLSLTTNMHLSQVWNSVTNLLILTQNLLVLTHSIWKDNFVIEFWSSRPLDFSNWMLDSFVLCRINWTCTQQAQQDILLLTAVTVERHVSKANFFLIIVLECKLFHSAAFGSSQVSGRAIPQT